MKTAVVSTQIALAFAILSLPMAMRGQDGASNQPNVHGPFTMESVIMEAASRYPAIRAAEAQQEAARNAIGVAQAAYLPRADMLWQLNRATTNKANLTPLGQTIVPIPTEPARETTGHSD